MSYPEGHWQIKADMQQRIERLREMFEAPVEGSTRNLSAEQCGEIRTLLRQLERFVEVI